MFHFVADGMFHHGLPEPLDALLRCYSSLSGANGPDAASNLDNGGKFILPPSILNLLTRLNITYPMLFHVTNIQNGRDSYGGVLEFIAPEGQCYAPKWMMKNLGLQEGDFIRVVSATLPTATYAKFEPQSVDFLEISNPKAMLENSLRYFATLTTGDVIGITYNDHLYELRVLETQPQAAVCCIECDMKVDFAPPIGYVEPKKQKQAGSQVVESDSGAGPSTEVNGIIPFTGAGCRLDGKAFTAIQAAVGPRTNGQRGQPDHDWKFGKIDFFRPKTLQHED